MLASSIRRCIPDWSAPPSWSGQWRDAGCERGNTESCTAAADAIVLHPGQIICSFRIVAIATDCHVALKGWLPQARTVLAAAAALLCMLTIFARFTGLDKPLPVPTVVEYCAYGGCSRKALPSTQSANPAVACFHEQCSTFVDCQAALSYHQRRFSMPCIWTPPKSTRVCGHGVHLDCISPPTPLNKPHPPSSPHPKAYPGQHCGRGQHLCVDHLFQAVRIRWGATPPQASLKSISLTFFPAAALLCRGKSAVQLIADEDEIGWSWSRFWLRFFVLVPILFVWAFSSRDGKESPRLPHTPSLAQIQVHLRPSPILHHLVHRRLLVSPFSFLFFSGGGGSRRD